MKKQSIVVSFLAAVIFSVGLALSGMTKPSKVIGFLDIFGNWDPSLAFVMVGAIAVYAISSRWILKNPAPCLDLVFHLPTQKEIDRRLILGAVLFGVGWGLAGYCPGPALVSVGTLSVSVLVFVVAMAAGMGFFILYERLRPNR